MRWALLKLRNVFQSIAAGEGGSIGSHILCTVLLICAVTFVYLFYLLCLKLLGQ